MTTDITELAQKRNSAISRLSRAFEPGHSSQKELDALSFAVDVMNELEEALEKAQQHIARQEQILLNQDESLSIRRGELEVAHQRIAELEREVIRLQSLKTVNAALQEAQSEFYRGYSCGHKDALLESRTVKLPRPGFVTISGERTAVYLKADVDAAILAAGIGESR